MNSKYDKGLFWLCLSVMILTPLSNDVFIGAFSIMEGVFDTDHLGLLLSVHLAGLALGQPFYGPLSDRFGRKPKTIRQGTIKRLTQCKACQMHTK